MIWRTAQGAGPFAVSEDFVGEAVIEVQGFVAIWAMVFLVARALSEGRRLALEQARVVAAALRANAACRGRGDRRVRRRHRPRDLGRRRGAGAGRIDHRRQHHRRMARSHRSRRARPAQATWSGVASGELPGSEQDYAIRTPDGRVHGFASSSPACTAPTGRSSKWPACCALRRLRSPKVRTSHRRLRVADEPGVFLIHGLGGTQYDLGSMHKRLKNAGFVTHSLTLPGHGTKPEDLAGVRAEDWIEAVRVKYREVRRAARDAARDGHVHGRAARRRDA